MEQARSKGRWFKLAEAAQLLGVSEITVRRKAKSGHLKAILRNGRYMVFLEEDPELGMFTAALDSAITPPPQQLPTSKVTTTLANRNRAEVWKNAEIVSAPAQDELIQSLKRTIEDQQTLISSLEASISRLSQKLAGERNSSR